MKMNVFISGRRRRKRRLRRMNDKPHIPDFRLIGQCGRGGSCTVWLAVDRNGIRRAIRILDRLPANRRERLEMEEAGAISLYRQSVAPHRNLLEILHVGRTDQHLYCVTDPADNASGSRTEYHPDTLAGRIRTRLYSENQMLDWIEALLDGVEQLHRSGLSHRDLKPENILFLHGRLTIGDPGLAAPAPAPVRGGTREFHPPWSPADGTEIDLYAIGKIIYCLYSGMDATAFPELPPDLDLRRIAGVNRIALKCCESLPAARYRSVAEIRRDLRALRAGNGQTFQSSPLDSK